MPMLTKDKRARILSVLSTYGERGASVREVLDQFESPDRDTPHYTKSVVRRQLEVLVKEGKATRRVDWPSRDVAYVAG